MIVALVLMAGPLAAAVDTDLARYVEAERAGALAPVSGRVYAEPRAPEGPEVPFTGAAVVAMPWSETLVRRLHALRDGARSSARAYREAARLMQEARETYEKAVWEAGAADLVRTALVDAAGRFDLGLLPRGRWLILVVSEQRHEVRTPSPTRKDREMFTRSPRLVGLRSRLVWLRELDVTAMQETDLQLTDRNVWFTGVVEDRVREGGARR